MVTLSKHQIQSIERRRSICLGHGGIIKRRIQKILHGIGWCRLSHDRLSNVHNLGSLVAEAVDTKQCQRLEMKYQLEHTHLLTRNLCPRRILEERLAHLIGNLRRG